MSCSWRWATTSSRRVRSSSVHRLPRLRRRRVDINRHSPSCNPSIQQRTMRVERQLLTLQLMGKAHRRQTINKNRERWDIGNVLNFRCHGFVLFRLYVDIFDNSMMKIKLSTMESVKSLIGIVFFMQSWLDWNFNEKTLNLAEWASRVCFGVDQNSSSDLIQVELLMQSRIASELQVQHQINICRKPISARFFILFNFHPLHLCCCRWMDEKLARKIHENRNKRATSTKLRAF